MNHRWIRKFDVVLCLTLSALFLLSAAYKFSNPDVVPRIIGKLPSVPAMSDQTRHWIGGGIAGLELFLGVALLLRFQLRLALCLAICTPIVFAMLVAPFYEILGGDCGCLWSQIPFSPTSGAALIFRNVIIASCALLALQLLDSRSRAVVDSAVRNRE